MTLSHLKRRYLHFFMKLRHHLSLAMAVLNFLLWNLDSLECPHWLAFKLHSVIVNHDRIAFWPRRSIVKYPAIAWPTCSKGRILDISNTLPGEASSCIGVTLPMSSKEMQKSGWNLDTLAGYVVCLAWKEFEKEAVLEDRDIGKVWICQIVTTFQNQNFKHEQPRIWTQTSSPSSITHPLLKNRHPINRTTNTPRHIQRHTTHKKTPSPQLLTNPTQFL